MAKSKTVTDPPPPIYSKLRLSPSMADRCGQCCLTAKNWQRLRDRINENFEHPDLPSAICGKLTVDQLLAFTQDKLDVKQGDLLLSFHAMDIRPLPFRRKLDKEAIREAVKNLGWSIDENGLIERGGDGLPDRN